MIGSRPWVLREADPDAERAPIVAALGRNLPRAVHPGRHEWLYLANPCGRALVWVVEDEQSGAVVGTASAHVRRVRVCGEIVQALNLGDFALDPEYRSLGPALRLLRATLEPVRSGRFAFSYDHPNEVMTSIYRRLGGVSLGRMRRLVRPVRSSRYLERRLGAGMRSRLAGAAGDLALRLRDTTLRVSSAVRVDELEGPFDESFTEFDRRWSESASVVGVRDADYLRWRFGRHPIWRHGTLLARRHGGLVGYTVFRGDPAQGVEIVELCALPDREAAAALVAELVGRVRRAGGESLSAQALAGSLAERVFDDLGFRAREEGSGAVPWAPEGSPLREIVGAAGRWWMLEGDRDV